MLIHADQTKKFSDVNLKKINVTDNEKYGTKLLCVCIIGQADEIFTCSENSAFRTDTELLNSPTPVSYGTLESITVFTA
jgi:hypothetical protein